MGSNSSAGGPVPREWISHALILLPDGLPPFRDYLDLLPKVFPTIDTHTKGWMVQGGSRKRMYGPLVDGDWRWHLYFEAAPLPAMLHHLFLGHKPTDEIRAVLGRHRSHVLVFLQERPVDARPFPTLHHLAGLVWPWLGYGAEAIGWPDGMRTRLRTELIPHNPLGLKSEHVPMFLSHEATIKDDQGRLWLRTRGMQMLGLPDLACTIPGVSAAPNLDETLEAAGTLFASMAPHMAETGGPLAIGATIQLEQRFWQVADPAAERIPFTSPFGIQLFRLIDPESYPA